MKIHELERIENERTELEARLAVLREQEEEVKAPRLSYYNRDRQDYAKTVPTHHKGPTGAPVDGDFGFGKYSISGLSGSGEFAIVLVRLNGPGLHAQIRCYEDGATELAEFQEEYNLLYELGSGGIWESADHFDRWLSALGIPDVSDKPLTGDVDEVNF